LFLYQKKRLKKVFCFFYQTNSRRVLPKTKQLFFVTFKKVGSFSKFLV
jgi:hypothetical protein